MSFAHIWATQSKQQHQAALSDFLIRGWPPNEDYLDLVRAPNHWGVYASTGLRFTDAIFGRDSIEVAEDLLTSHRTLVDDIIFTLARLQGTKFDTTSEEEPGKIHHEYRAVHLDGQIDPLPSHSLDILRELQNVWGGQGSDHMIYYGSHDATLLYVRLIGRYMAAYDDSELLNKTYVGSDDQTHTIAESMLAAVEWIVQKIEQAPAGLFTYKRINPNGLLNQAWKDSATAYLHSDGNFPNYENGIASVELQGYTYDALLAAADILHAQPEAVRENWRHLAHQIQVGTLEKLWMPQQKYFAQGIELDNSGNIRQIDTLTSNGAVLLDSNLLKNLPQEQSHIYLEGIVRTICGPEFLTPAGVRSRALRHVNIPNFVDYHGSYTVWPKETFDISKGLKNFGFAKLAMQLENYILKSVELASEFYEFFYVESDGAVWYDHAVSTQHFNEKNDESNKHKPEPGQAWTISAVYAILYSQAQDMTINTSGNYLEEELLVKMPTLNSGVHVIENLQDLFVPQLTP